MFSFKKDKSYLLKIHSVFFDEKEQEIMIKTHLIGENKLEVHFLSELLEDESAIKLIDPKELIRLKEIETLEKIKREKARISKIYFNKNEVEIFHLDSNYSEILTIPDLFYNEKIVNKLDKKDLLGLIKKHYYFSAPLQKTDRNTNNVFKLTVVK